MCKACGMDVVSGGRMSVIGGKMVVVCAWCQRELGCKTGPAGVSHGICSDCADEQIRTIPGRANVAGGDQEE